MSYELQATVFGSFGKYLQTEALRTAFTLTVTELGDAYDGNFIPDSWSFPVSSTSYKLMGGTNAQRIFRTDGGSSGSYWSIANHANESTTMTEDTAIKSNIFFQTPYPHLVKQWERSNINVSPEPQFHLQQFIPDGFGEYNFERNPHWDKRVCIYTLQQDNPNVVHNGGFTSGTCQFQFDFHDKDLARLNNDVGCFKRIFVGRSIPLDSNVNISYADTSNEFEVYDEKQQLYIRSVDLNISYNININT